MAQESVVSITTREWRLEAASNLIERHLNSMNIVLPAISRVVAKNLASLWVKETYKPNLGCATTEELIDELKARIGEKGLTYKTIDD